MGEPPGPARGRRPGVGEIFAWVYVNARAVFQSLGSAIGECFNAGFQIPKDRLSDLLNLMSERVKAAVALGERLLDPKNGKKGPDLAKLGEAFQRAYDPSRIAAQVGEHVGNIHLEGPKLRAMDVAGAVTPKARARQRAAKAALAEAQQAGDKRRAARAAAELAAIERKAHEASLERTREQLGRLGGLLQAGLGKAMAGLATGPARVPKWQARIAATQARNRAATQARLDRI